MNRMIRFIGLDVHKDFISVAVADEGSSYVESYGEITNTASSISSLAKRLSRQDCDLCFTYEAGCFGFVIYRQLLGMGHSCIVAAPSLIPRKPGERVKTDTRDALKLARLLRSGDLTACHVPDEGDEAMRDLVRARADAVRAYRVSRQQLNGFLLRHGKAYDGKSRWGNAHMHWLLDIKLAHEAQQIVLEEYRRRVEHDRERIDTLTEQIRRVNESWRWMPVVNALQALRGVCLVTAVTVVAELGDLRRFAHPKQMMSAVGLVPSEHSSGGKRHQGAITKTGNGHVRRVLVESGWNYRFPARLTREIERRQRGCDKEVASMAWRAQKRLCARYRQLSLRGKNAKLITTAVARELCGFVWDIAQQVAPAARK
ncbi:IS110 family transposase [Mariprofundus erugo]|uniref:IS110 family transposase n=1 Tax=Mariprofundus erugo TaxID=2528639 RepID=UPI0010FED3D5|nr:IS110 family transposase [Mariprofundus erugo]TLS72760.1 IS110 family transposase [Mariprofundus erugo]